jgi:hypothetical protein
MTIFVAPQSRERDSITRKPDAAIYRLAVFLSQSAGKAFGPLQLQADGATISRVCLCA